jgi:hypothetical protein
LSLGRAAILGIAVAAILPVLAFGAVERRGCQRRVEGPKVVPNPKADTVIGPMAFIGIPDTYRDYASRPDSELRRFAEDGFTSMKSLGVLRAGARVTLVVPRAQREWLKVVYDGPDFEGRSAFTLQACRRFDSPRAQRRECRWRPFLACRWRYTQFNGGFAVNFAEAPRRGLCARVAVRVRGRTEPLRRFVFDPEPGACGQ